MTDVAGHFVSLLGRKEAEKELAVLIEALSAVPPTERDSRLARSARADCRAGASKKLLNKANKMSTEELERRLEYLKHSAGVWTVRNFVSDSLR